MENKWNELWYRVKNWLPQRIIDWLDGKSTEEKPSHLFTYVTTAVIIALTFSSILNMNETTGRILAVCVPLSVFVGAHRWGALNNAQRFIAWMIAFASVVWSAFLQYGAYVDGVYSLTTMFSIGGDLSALTKALALPLSECSMAVLAAMVASSAEREYVQRKHRKDHEDRSTKIRNADEEDREAERRRIQELRSQQDALKLEQQRLQMESEHAARMAEIEANSKVTLIDAEAKAQAKIARANGSANGTDNGKRLETKSAQRSESEHDLMRRMIAIYQSNPSASNRSVADEIGVSHTTVSDLLSNLVSKEVVHVEKQGRGKMVTVNGKLSAFMNGELD